MSFDTPVVLGRTGLKVSRLGISASYGVPAKAVERAYHEHGINLFYWGSMRRPPFGKAVKNLAKQERDKMVILLQSYDRTGMLMPIFHERGLKSLEIDYADILLLGWHNNAPAPRVMEAALKLKEEGKVRFLAMSGHRRTAFGELARTEHPCDIFMVRYNAAHRGAEQDIFPHLPDAASRPGMMAYTATCWGKLLKANKMPPGEKPMTAAECYRFALSTPSFDVCMTGPSNEQQMLEGLTALNQGPLTPEEMARAHRIGDFVHG